MSNRLPAAPGGLGSAHSWRQTNRLAYSYISLRPLDHSARGSMKTGVKPETVCELQDTNDHRQVERKWRLPISVGKLSALEGRLMNLWHIMLQPWTFVMSHAHVVNFDYMASSQVPLFWLRLLFTRWRPCPELCIRASVVRLACVSSYLFRPRGCWTTHWT